MPTAGNVGSFLRTYAVPIPTQQYQVIDTTASGSLPGAESYALSTRAAKGKIEPLSFVIRSGEALTGIVVTATDLTGPATIPASAIDIRVVKTWYQASNGNDSSVLEKTLIPELLLKDDDLINTDRVGLKSYLKVVVSGTPQDWDITTYPPAAFPAGGTVQDATTFQGFPLDANINKQIWLDISVPSDATAGEYSGFIAVDCDGHATTYLSVALTVLNFVLEQSILDYGIYYRAQLKTTPSPPLTSEERTSTQMAAEFANMLAHGVKYPTIYDAITTNLVDERLALMSAAGMPTDKMFQAGDNFHIIGDNPTTVGNKTQDWVNLANSLGWGDVFMYAYDEPSEAQFDSALAAIDVIHTKSAGSSNGKAFTALIDMAKATRSGVEKYDWFNIYGYGITSANIATVHGTNDVVAMYGLPFADAEHPQNIRNSYGFGLLYDNYDGGMNYVYQDIGTNRASGNIWNDFKSDPITALERNMCWTYPTSNGVVDTLQWQGFREGVDDTRYASTLKTLKGWTKAELSAYIKGLSTQFENPLSNDADATRQAVIDEILATLATPSGAIMDDFNRADVNPIGGNWTTVPIYGAIFNAGQIIGNKLCGTSNSGDCSAYWNAYTPGANQWIQYTVGAKAGNAANFGAWLRGGAATGYGFRHNPNAPSTDIIKVVADVTTPLVSETTTTFQVNDVIYFEVRGSTITLKVNGVTILTTSNGDITATGYMAVRIPAYSSVATDNSIDNFSGGDLGTPRKIISAYTRGL